MELHTLQRYDQSGFMHCTQCKVLDVALTTHCYDFPLDEYWANSVYRGEKDFINNTWVARMSPYCIFSEERKGLEKAIGLAKTTKVFVDCSPQML